MGKKLQEYYETVVAKGGVQARMRLAMRTGVPSAKAGEVPDSPELLEKFKAAAKEILGDGFKPL